MKRISFDGIDLCGYCLGTMYFGTKVSDGLSLRMMDIYADMGGNFLDTANKYSCWAPGGKGGESEMLIGKWLKGRRREDYIISSKVGFPYGDIPKSLAGKLIISECEKSLGRLGTDYIDVYFAHAQDLDTPLEESMLAFDTLVKAGKVRLLGASNHDVSRLDDSNKVAGTNGWNSFSILQQRNTLLAPSPYADFGNQRVLTSEMRRYCADNSIAVMAYSPLQGGIFSYKTESLPPEYDIPENYIVINTINRYARESGYSQSQLVLATMLEVQGIIPIVAASSEEHLSESLTLPDSAVVRNMANELKAYLLP